MVDRSRRWPPSSSTWPRRSPARTCRPVQDNELKREHRLRTGSVALHGLYVDSLGATGHGLSLCLDLLARRASGAAGTGAGFAFAPFIGAAVAVALGDRDFSLWMLPGSTPMRSGVRVRLAESRGHEHTHDGGHHDHGHEIVPQGAHGHAHRHDGVTHDHAQVPDLHHAHRHGATGQAAARPATLPAVGREQPWATRTPCTARRI